MASFKLASVYVLKNLAYKDGHTKPFLIPKGVIPSCVSAEKLSGGECKGYKLSCLLVFHSIFYHVSCKPSKKGCFRNRQVKKVSSLKPGFYDAVLS